MYVEMILLEKEEVVKEESMVGPSNILLMLFM
jgi:hypothetical protein